MMSRAVPLARKIKGCPLEDVNTYYHTTLEDVNTSYHARLTIKARAIISDPQHPQNQCYTWLPSRRRLCSFITRTSLFNNTFVPLSVVYLNAMN